VKFAAVLPRLSQHSPAQGACIKQGEKQQRSGAGRPGGCGGSALGLLAVPTACF